MTLMLLLAGAALCLACLGIYGVVSQAVAQRTSEFGIRMALGATAGRIRLAVLRQGMGPVTAGVLVGLALAVGVGRLLRSLLFQVSPTDMLPLVASAVVLVLVAVAASLIPARRASRIDPMTALRVE